MLNSETSLFAVWDASLVAFWLLVATFVVVKVVLGGD
jgi:hypothetical protein